MSEDVEGEPVAPEQNKRNVEAFRKLFELADRKLRDLALARRSAAEVAEEPPQVFPVPEKDVSYERWKLLTGGVVPLPLPDRSTAFLLLGHVMGEELGYKGAKVLAAPLMPELGDIVALLVGTGQEVPKDREVWKLCRFRELKQKWSHDERRFREELLNAPELRETRPKELRETSDRLRLPDTLLGCALPNYEDMPEKEKTALLRKMCDRIRNAQEAMSGVRDFFVRGTPAGLPKIRVADVQSDMRAAELRDALNLPYLDIARVLGMPLPAAQDRKALHQKVSQMTRRGTEKFLEFVGDAGYQKHLQAVGPELRRYADLRLNPPE